MWRKWLEELLRSSPRSRWCARILLVPWLCSASRRERPFFLFLVLTCSWRSTMPRLSIFPRICVQRPLVPCAVLWLRSRFDSYCLCERRLPRRPSASRRRSVPSPWESSLSRPKCSLVYVISNVFNTVVFVCYTCFQSHFGVIITRQAPHRAFVICRGNLICAFGGRNGCFRQN